jgi:hypothetical protein
MRVFPVPVIAVFTKYDYFRRKIKFQLEDQRRDPELLDTEVKSTFEREYLSKLRKSAPFIHVEGENFANQLESTTLMTVPQGCTRNTNSVPNLSKGLTKNSLPPSPLYSWLHRRIFPKTPTTSSFESSSSEEQMRERPRFSSEWVIPPRVQRSTGVIHRDVANGYVLIPGGTSDLII